MKLLLYLQFPFSCRETGDYEDVEFAKCAMKNVNMTEL